MSEETFEVHAASNNDLVIFQPGESVLFPKHVIPSKYVDALRDFFQQERDYQTGPDRIQTLDVATPYIIWPEGDDK